MIRRQLGGPVALVAAAAVAVGCDPAPRYAPPQPPYVGVTYAEGSVVATGVSQSLSIVSQGLLGENGVTLSVPAGAYPPGTRLTLRWVDDLGLVGSDIDQLDQFKSRGNLDSGDIAVQVLPAAPPPASALTLTLPAPQPTSYDILHAGECDDAWQIAGTAQAAALGSSSSSYPYWASFEITSPGLWALGQPPDGGLVPTPVRPEAGCRAVADGGGQ